MSGKARRPNQPRSRGREENMGLHPPLPVADELTAPFWDGIRNGKLRVQRCVACERFQFPPRASCEHCASTVLSFEDMSGRGKIFSFSETVAGARHPYFQSISPYLVGMVQLEEQDDLIFASNFPDADYADLFIGAPVEVEFQEVADGAVIPQFRLVAAPQESR
ncbi:MAG: hypothetical protein EON59_14050 [Alphaproteobacteria bacterium]|nr:MAG: hypothetical protein EON59_14050 [Alphaproteobacteria bacterium]